MDGITSDNLTEKNAEASFIAWYDELCAERMSMLEAEESYKRRIRELEKNNFDLLQAFDEVQGEIKQLRMKYEPDLEENKYEYHESYDIVYKEREELKKENISLKAKLGKSYLKMNDKKYNSKTPGRRKMRDKWESISKSPASIDDINCSIKAYEKNTPEPIYVTNTHKPGHSSVDLTSNRKKSNFTRKVFQKENNSCLMSNMNKTTETEKEKPVSKVALRSVENRTMLKIHEKISESCICTKRNIEEAMHKHGVPFHSGDTVEYKYTYGPFVKSYTSIYLSRKNLRKMPFVHLPPIQKGTQHPTEMFTISRETLFR